MNSERKNYPMKEFGQFFRFHRFWSSGPGMRKKNFSILAVFQNIWDLHKFGLQIWIQNAKITLWKNFGNFFDFIDFGHQVRVCKKRFSAVFIWDHKFGLHFEFRTQKLPYERISGNFSDFYRFWLSGPGMQKKVISQY